MIPAHKKIMALSTAATGIFLWVLSPGPAYASVPVHFLTSQPIHCNTDTSMGTEDYNCKKEREFDSDSRDIVRSQLKKLIDNVQKGVTASGYKPHSGQYTQPEKVGGAQAGTGYLLNYEWSLREYINRRGVEYQSNFFNVDPIESNTLLSEYMFDVFTEPEQLPAQFEPEDEYDVDVDYDDFYAGEGSGWDSFLSVGLDPRKEPYGMAQMAIESKLEKEQAFYDSFTQYLSNNRGFVGQRQEYLSGCQSDEICWTEYETQKPGGLMAEELEKTVTVDFDWLMSSDEVKDKRVNPTVSQPQNTEQIVDESTTEPEYLFQIQDIFQLEPQPVP